MLAWLYKSLCRAANRNVVQVTGPLDLPQRWIFWRFPILRPYGFDDIEWPLASRWYRYLPTSDEKRPRLQAQRRQLDLMPFSDFFCLPYRTLAVEVVLDRSILQVDHRALWCSIVPLIYFGTIEWHQVDRVILHFGGVQNRPHLTLNIDFLHVKDGRGSDQWFPQTYQRWHGLWATRFEQLFNVAQSADPGPTTDFLQSWIFPARRYLVPANHFHCLPPDEIPVEATQTQSGPHPARPNVPHVPDNRRPGRRMMVGTRTTARDWQWLDKMMAKDAPVEQPTQKIRRMPESYARRRGAGRPRRGGRAGSRRGEGVTRRLPSTLRVVPAPVFLDELSSSGFQQMISDILQEGDGGYRPDTQFDGSQVHLDLNALCLVHCMCLWLLVGLLHLQGGTPPSAAHVPGGSWEVPFMEPAHLSTPLASHAPF
ncbi:hypothetical protein PIB30_042718 [Stylosanthes scabra]|uniref:Aminotransferase-like plant mobile domain-containing protein n=1 Tax=Stylosanthes scabra TaxID=79078 RepID=A0ABU6ZE27_9FABA|nr:hypothetical protein [Stylosanthes scabra]